MEGGYLVVSLMREEDTMTLLLGHLEGSCIYVAVSFMREGDPTNLPLQAITTQGFMLMEPTLP